MSKHIKFEEVENTNPNAKTRIWYVVEKKTGNSLGMVSWFTRWRKYCFHPSPNCVFDSSCLSDIAKSLDKANSQHKEKE